jgi:hypothetical protein
MAFIGNTPISVAFLTDTFSGNGSTTAFTMTVAPANTSSIIVAITGVLQDPSTYSVSGTTLTFSAAPPTGTSNISVRYLGIPASGVTTTAYRTVTDFTATAGQTSFSVPSYTIGYIDVYRNGVRLVSTDYTATTGTTVVLTNACTVGDAVVTESFYVSSVLNAIPATAGSVGTTYLADNSVTTAKIAAGAVVQADLATGVAGTGPAFSATTSTTQSVTSATYTKVNFGTENFDTNSNFASSRFTPTVAGYYFISGSIYSVSTAAATYIWAIIFKNGGLAFVGNLNVPVSGVDGIGTVNGLLYMNGSTDYVEMYCYLVGTSPVIQTGANTVFSGFLARGA